MAMPELTRRRNLNALANAGMSFRRVPLDTIALRLIPHQHADHPRELAFFGPLAILKKARAPQFGNDNGLAWPFFLFPTAGRGGGGAAC